MHIAPPSAVDPSFSLSFGIFLKENNQEQEMIGYIDIILDKFSSPGWPWIAYVLKKEYWGKKYGTEFLQTFITYWSNLPREQVQLLIDPKELDFQPVHEATLQVTATVRLNNLGSRGILRNSGFEEIPDNTDCSNWIFKMD
jgi:RimJ/RimL family protein N-acetyltransferase